MSDRGAIFRGILSAMIVIAIVTRGAAGEESTGADELWQTNAAGDDLHIINMKSFKVMQRLVVGPQPHGIAVSEDAGVVYVSIEANEEERGRLLWIDPVERKIVHRIEVGPEPHAIATTPDGHWVYVPCRDGTYWVVDGWERKVVKRIRTGGRPHNTQASSDGRFMYLSPMGDPHRVTIVNVQRNHKVVGHLPFSDSVRPPALEENGQRFFQHVDGLYGFEVADIESRKYMARVEHGRQPGGLLLVDKLGWLGWGGFSRCHGLAVRPEAAELWSCCDRSVFIHDLADSSFPQKAVVDLPGDAYWLTFSPDGRWAAVALSDRNQVAMVDTGSRKVEHLIDVGESPKRNVIFTLPGLAASE